ncbi:unnamed protein product, partial [Rotaria sordida]
YSCRICSISCPVCCMHDSSVRFHSDHGRELSDEDKNFNRDINSARAAIENINQRLKTYAIIGGVYRGAIDDFEKTTKIVQVVAALCNMNLDKHPIRE